MTPSLAPPMQQALASGVAGGPSGLTPGSLRLARLHFSAALIFLLLGAVGVVEIAPLLVQGAFTDPRVAAVTHLFTLGWLTTTILGALYQFLPVAFGLSVRSERAASYALGGYMLGLPLFLTGLLGRSHLPLLAGAVLFSTALLGAVANLALTLKRARRRDLTWWCLAAALGFLTFTVVLGASLAGNLRWGYLGDGRFLAVAVHLHVALAGWVLLVMIGVADRLLPMFLVCSDAPAKRAHDAGVLTASGAGILLFFHHYLYPPVLWAVTVLLIAGVTSFAAQAFLYFRMRRRPMLDAGLRLSATGIVFLLLAALFSPLVMSRGAADPVSATAYALALILGGFALFVAGNQYKIVPFLVWYLRYASAAGRMAVPPVAALYSARLATLAGMLLTTGAAFLVGAVLMGSPAVARAAAVLYLGGATVMASQLLPLLRDSHAR